MSKREKEFAPIDHSRVEPAWKVILMMILGLLVGIPFVLFMYGTWQGEKLVAKWLGVDSGILGLIVQTSFYLLFFLSQRVCRLYEFYKISNLEPVKSIYHSQILRLTYTLLSLEDQEAIMEPVYSDWLDERESVEDENAKSALFKVDLYYYLWFSWRIWKETRVIECYRKRSVRSPYSQEPSIFPKK